MRSSRLPNKAVTIKETDRLILREIDSATDAEFIFELLNTPKFLKFIGDRGVRSIPDAAEFIDTKYRQSYLENGFGLYTMERKSDRTAIGMCGLVKRESLAGPDIGFALLPDFEGKGYGFEAAAATMDHARALGLSELFAITTPDNVGSVALLGKLGFTEAGMMTSANADELRLFRRDL